MKKAEIVLGENYIASVSGMLCVVCIMAVSPKGGWVAKNIATGRGVRIRSAQRLRRKATLFDRLDQLESRSEALSSRITTLLRTF